MDKEKNALSSRKITNRLPSRDGPITSLAGNVNSSTPTNLPTTKDNLLMTSTGDNFFRKSGKGFNSSSFQRSDNYGIMKSDLYQLQEMINENAYLTKMYKITSKSHSFTKRLTEIEENKDIKLLVDKISEEASNVDKMGKIYNVTNTTELIQKLALDVFYMDLLLKKINEYFLVLQLKIGGDENLYQESHSKLFIIKIAVEKLLEKSYSNGENSNKTTEKENMNSLNTESNSIKLNQNIPSLNSFDDSAYKKILEIDSLPELIRSYKNSDNKVLKHLSDISSQFVEKLNSNYNDLIQKYSQSGNAFNNNLQLDGFITQKLLIEKIINEKDKDMEILKKNMNETIEINKKFEDKIKSLDDEIINLKKNLEENKKPIITEKISSHGKDNYSDENNSVESLKKIIEESKINLFKN
jgi:hypothetical protein